MPALNEKPVRLLIRDMAAAFDLKPGEAFTRERAVRWFQEHFPNVKQSTVTAHLIRLSTNAATRLHYGVREDGSDDFLYKVDSSRFRLYDKQTDPTPILPGDAVVGDEPLDERANEGSSEFAYEHDLRDYLARNLHLLEPGLTLYADEAVKGIEFPVGGRFVDILALDAHKNYVVIELKVSRGYDRTVGQLLRYVGWIRRYQADAGQSVRGIIVAKDISEDLRLACADLENVTLYEYSLAITLKPVPARMGGT